jgi:drug/metabolite transporter (DMT)-like permease
MRHLPSSVANLVMTTEPVFTALIAFRLFDERLSGPQLAGSALVLGGVLLLRFSEGWRAGSHLSPRAVEE